MKRKFTTHPKHQQIPPGSFSPWDHLTLRHSEWSSNKHVNLSHQTSRQPACTLVQWAPTRLSSPSSGFQPLSLEGWQQSYPAVQPSCNSLRQIFSPAPCSGYLLWVLPESKTKGSPCQFELVLQATSDLILSFRSYCNKQFTNSQTFWAGGLGTGVLPVCLCCACCRVVLNWGHVKPEKGMGGERRMWQL